MLGWPANGNSARGVKIRTSAVCCGSLGGRTNVVSARLNSAAMACICSVVSPRASGKTANGFPTEASVGEDIDRHEVQLHRCIRPYCSNSKIQIIWRCHSGARPKAESPEPITPVWDMDSGLAATRRPGMTERWHLSGFMEIDWSAFRSRLAFCCGRDRAVHPASSDPSPPRGEHSPLQQAAGTARRGCGGQRPSSPYLGVPTWYGDYSGNTGPWRRLGGEELACGGVYSSPFSAAWRLLPRSALAPSRAQRYQR